MSLAMSALAPAVVLRGGGNSPFATRTAGGSSAPDSERTLHEAQVALRFFQRRYRIFVGQSAPLRVAYSCTSDVPPYCYGPDNGGIPYGWNLGALPVAFPTADTVVPKDLRKKVQGFLKEALKDLDALQKKSPGDRWIVGQRVFQRVGDRRFEEALGVARSCRSNRWWCAALAGYVHVLLNNTAQADSAFDVALHALPDDQRCVWEDISDLVYGDPDRDWYRDLSCAEREQANETLWWLADPLYMTPGNERRTEHYYRVVYAMLFDDAREVLPYREVGPKAPRWPAAPRIPSLPNWSPASGPELWDRDLWDFGALLPLARSLGTPGYLVVGGKDAPDQFLLQFPQPTYHFLPALTAVQAPMHATTASWTVDDARAPERYHPRLGYFASLQYQIGYFRRGDSARVVAAADVNGGALRLGDSTRLLAAALVLSRSATDPKRLVPSARQVAVPRYDVITTRDSTLVSVEAIAAGYGAERARFAAGPPRMPAQRVAMSDLVLLDRPDLVPLTLDAAAPHLAPNVTVAEGSAAGVFWEMYGLSGDDTVHFTLSSTERGSSVFARLGRLLGVTSQPSNLGVSWVELPKARRAVEGRSVSVDMSSLKVGTYDLHLEIQVPGQESVTVAREVRVVARGVGSR
jgi:hypothetical protein